MEVFQNTLQNMGQISEIIPKNEGSMGSAGINIYIYIYLYLYLYLYIHRSILESLFNPMNHQMIEVVPFPVCLYIVVLDNLLFVYIVCQLHFSLHLRVTVNMDPPGRWFSSFVWAKVASVFGEYSSQQASQRYGSCIFLPTVIRRQVFDGVCFSKAVGRCQNALKFLNRWKQCFSQDRTWDAIHVIRDSNTSDVTIPFF